MIDRIKKKQYEGFKEFVQNMEVTETLSRQKIFLSGVLEDPIFMSHVVKNLKTIDDFLTLPSKEIDLVLKSHEQMVMMMAKSLFGAGVEKLNSLEAAVPKWGSLIKEEFGYIKELRPEHQETAKFFILKAVRKFQEEGLINGFHWELPSQEIFNPKTYPDGKTQICFENGVVAAEGEMIKNKRLGFWRHYFDTGKVLAEGEYSESLKTGTWIFYHSNGSHKAQGKYKGDKRQGLWKEWDRSGNLTENDYHEGVKKE